MGRKNHSPEQIIGKLREAEVHISKQILREALAYDGKKSTAQ
jgi:hypothetical protein